MTLISWLRIANLLLFVVGTLLIILPIGATLLGLDLTPGFGMVQMSQVLLGLTLLTAAGYWQIYSLRLPGTPRSLQADVGIRLGATGLVLAYVTGFSDLLGIGTHVEPRFVRPVVGWLQMSGLTFSVSLITVGMLLYFTSRGTRSSSSLRFLLGRENSSENGSAEQPPA